jgi:hypothetical protein
MTAIEAAALLRPLHAFSRILREWKQEMLRDPSASGVRVHGHGIITSEQEQRLQRDQIERMPTWVLGRADRWRLVGANILVAAPILLAVAGFIQV